MPGFFPTKQSHPPWRLPLILRPQPFRRGLPASFIAQTTLLAALSPRPTFAVSDPIPRPLQRLCPFLRSATTLPSSPSLVPPPRHFFTGFVQAEGFILLCSPTTVTCRPLPSPLFRPSSDPRIVRASSSTDPPSRSIVQLSRCFSFQPSAQIVCVVPSTSMNPLSATTSSSEGEVSSPPCYNFGALAPDPPTPVPQPHPFFRPSPR